MYLVQISVIVSISSSTRSSSRTSDPIRPERYIKYFRFVSTLNRYISVSFCTSRCNWDESQHRLNLNLKQIHVVSNVQVLLTSSYSTRSLNTSIVHLLAVHVDQWIRFSSKKCYVTSTGISRLVLKVSRRFRGVNTKCLVLLNNKAGIYML